MERQKRHTFSIIALVLLSTTLFASQAAAQGRAEMDGAEAPDAALAMLSSTVSVVRVLGLPEQIQAAVIEVARTLEADESETATEGGASETFQAADADRQSALESEALEALERGEPVESASTESGRSEREASEPSASGEGARDASATDEQRTRRAPTTVEGVVERHHDEIEACYRQRLSSRPRLAGSVTLKFTVRADGSVAAPVVDDSSLGDEKVETCLLRTIASLQFPEPVSGQRTVWRFPFEFRPAIR